MKWTSWTALLGLGAIGGFVVWSSLGAGGIRCEICLEFRGAEACRAVDGASEDEALAAARTNACAQLAAGVTDTLACERTTPRSQSCRAR